MQLSGLPVGWPLLSFPHDLITTLPYFHNLSYGLVQLFQPTKISVEDGMLHLMCAQLSMPSKACDCQTLGCKAEAINHLNRWTCSNPFNESEIKVNLQHAWVDVFILFQKNNLGDVIATPQKSHFVLQKMLGVEICLLSRD